MSDIAKLGVSEVFDLADHAVSLAGSTAENAVGLAGDAAQGVVDLGAGIGKLTVGEARDLAAKIVSRLRAVATDAADAIPVG